MIFIMLISHSGSLAVELLAFNAGVHKFYYHLRLVAFDFRFRFRYRLSVGLVSVFDWHPTETMAETETTNSQVLRCDRIFSVPLVTINYMMLMIS